MKTIAWGALGIFLFIISLCVGLVAIGADAPVLSKDAKTELQIALKDFQIAQLEVQLAQTRADSLRQVLTQKLKENEKDGFILDLQTWVYTPKTTEKTP